jgi:hypothetical protein
MDATDHTRGTAARDEIPHSTAAKDEVSRLAKDEIPKAVHDWFATLCNDPTLLNRLPPDMLRMLLMYTEVLSNPPVEIGHARTTVRELIKIVQAAEDDHIGAVSCCRCNVLLYIVPKCECSKCDGLYEYLDQSRDHCNVCGCVLCTECNIKYKKCTCKPCLEHTD